MRVGGIDDDAVGAIQPGRTSEHIVRRSPDPDQHRIAWNLNAVGQADAGDLAVDPFDGAHRGIEHDANAIGFVAALNEIRQQGRGDTRQHTCLPFDHGDIRSERASGGGSFQSDVSGADDRELQARPQHRFEAIGVGHRAEFENTAEAASRHRQRPRLRAERKDQMVVGNGLAGPERQRSVRAVDSRHRRRQVQRNGVRGIERCRPQQQSGEIVVSLEPGLGEWWALIGWDWFGAEKGDRPLPAGTDAAKRRQSLRRGRRQ